LADNYVPTARRLREKDREENNVVDVRGRKGDGSGYQRGDEPTHFQKLEKRDQFVDAISKAQPEGYLTMLNNWLRNFV